MATAAETTKRLQLFIGGGLVLLAVVMAAGAWFIPSAAGYAGVGPNFLPWVVSAALLVCGAMLAWQASHGGYREVEPASGAARGDWKAFAWVSAGALAIAALITTIGFILACTLGFMLAVRGLRLAEGKPGGDVRVTTIDAVTGFAISAPVFWLFRQLLGLSLPAITAGGWI
jgi:putative tricarboxylic transport membrane protein